MFLPVPYSPAAVPAANHVVTSHAPEPLSLRAAVDTALRASLRLRAAGMARDAARASVRGAGALPGPEILITPTLLGRSGSDSEVLISQPLQVNGIRGARAAAASARLASASKSAQALARDLELEVRTVYWDLVEAHGRVTIARSHEASAEALLKAAQRQVELGAQPGVHVTKAELEVAAARADSEAAEAAVVRCAALLNTLMGRAPDAPLAPSDRLEDQATEAPGAGTRAASFERPDVAAVAHEARAAEADARAAALATAPDLALQARAERIDGDRGVALVLNLPLVDWGQARAGRTAADLQRQALALQADHARKVAASEALSAAAEVSRLAPLVARYRDDVVGRSEALEGLAAKGYERGATSYIEVLEARRASKEARLGYLSLLADLARARSKRAWAEGGLSSDVPVQGVDR